jgi:hypothetical protein
MTFVGKSWPKLNETEKQVVKAYKLLGGIFQKW